MGHRTSDVGEHRDVTETRRIEAGLDLNERYLSILGGLTQDGVFHRDLDGTLTFANQSYFDISGLQSADTSLADLDLLVKGIKEIASEVPSPK